MICCKLKMKAYLPRAGEGDLLSSFLWKSRPPRPNLLRSRLSSSAKGTTRSCRNAIIFFVKFSTRQTKIDGKLFALLLLCFFCSAHLSCPIFMTSENAFWKKLQDHQKSYFCTQKSPKFQKNCRDKRKFF